MTNIPAPTPPKLLLDDTLAKTVMKSVQKSLTVLFSTSASASPYAIHKDYASKGDISGILGMVQDTVEATMVVSFQKETLFYLLGKMYGRVYTEVDSSVKQGTGELTNIIYGSMKKDLNDKGHSFKMSIPSVVIGNGHTIFSLHDGNSMVIPFHVENAGDFFVQITLQNSR